MHPELGNRRPSLINNVHYNNSLCNNSSHYRHSPALDGLHSQKFGYSKIQRKIRKNSICRRNSRFACVEYELWKTQYDLPYHMLLIGGKGA